MVCMYYCCVIICIIAVLCMYHCSAMYALTIQNMLHIVLHYVPNVNHYIIVLL